MGVAILKKCGEMLYFAGIVAHLLDFFNKYHADLCPAFWTFGEPLRLGGLPWPEEPQVCGICLACRVQNTAPVTNRAVDRAGFLLLHFHLLLFPF